MENDGEVGLGPLNFSNQEENDTLQDLENRLRCMRSCYSRMKEHGSELQEALIDFESSLGNANATIMRKSSAISEKSELFGIAAHAMMSSCEYLLTSSESEVHKVVKLLQTEKIRLNKLEKMVQDVAKEHTSLERKATRFSHLVGLQEPIEAEEDDEVSEIGSNEEEENVVNISEVDSLHIIRQSILSNTPLTGQRNLRYSDDFEMPPLSTMEEQKRNLIFHRRSHVPERPNIPFNTWSVLKNSIGMDLSKIPLPVNFNEPLTMLQRLTEGLEYAALLDFAAKIDDEYEQIAYVAAFTISICSSSAQRINKPFNPLLGETYEFDRSRDLGWRSIAEQVSHHPPVSALYCQGNGWTFWQDYSMSTKFRGKNLEVHPSGSNNCRFHKTGITYTWGEAGTMIYNVIVGKMWIDHYGQVDIVGQNSASEVKCELNYVPYSIFSSENQRRVNGVVKNKLNEVKFIIKGMWDLKVEIAKVLSTKNVKHEPVYHTGDFITIWRKYELDPESHKYHYFSKFTCELNELEAGVAPTDSRLRPDLRLMEQGNWDESNLEKLRLEEKQRKKRPKSFEDANDSTYEPVWFQREIVNDRVTFRYKGTYWKAKSKKNWSQCPDIF